MDALIKSCICGSGWKAEADSLRQSLEAAQTVIGRLEGELEGEQARVGDSQYGQPLATAPTDAAGSPSAVERLASTFAMEFMTGHYRPLKEDEQKRFDQLRVVLLAFAASVRRVDEQAHLAAKVLALDGERIAQYARAERLATQVVDTERERNRWKDLCETATLGLATLQECLEAAERERDDVLSELKAIRKIAKAEAATRIGGVFDD